MSHTTDYMEEHIKKLDAENRKLQALLNTATNLLEGVVAEAKEEYKKLEAIRDITNQTGTAMTRLIKIREVLDG